MKLIKIILLFLSMPIVVRADSLGDVLNVAKQVKANRAFKAGKTPDQIVVLVGAVKKKPVDIKSAESLAKMAANLEKGYKGKDKKLKEQLAKLKQSAVRVLGDVKKRVKIAADKAKAQAAAQAAAKAKAEQEKKRVEEQAAADKVKAEAVAKAEAEQEKKRAQEQAAAERIRQAELEKKRREEIAQQKKREQQKKSEVRIAEKEKRRMEAKAAQEKAMREGLERRGKKYRERIEQVKKEEEVRTQEAKKRFEQYHQAPEGAPAPAGQAAPEPGFVPGPPPPPPPPGFGAAPEAPTGQAVPRPGFAPVPPPPPPGFGGQPASGVASSKVPAIRRNAYAQAVAENNIAIQNELLQKGLDYVAGLASGKDEALRRQVHPLLPEVIAALIEQRIVTEDRMAVALVPNAVDRLKAIAQSPVFRNFLALVDFAAPGSHAGAQPAPGRKVAGAGINLEEILRRKFRNVNPDEPEEEE